MFSFFLGFLFQSIQVTFGIFGLGVVVILGVRAFIMFPGSRVLPTILCARKVDYSPLAHVQPTPSHLASAEGKEREETVKVDGDAKPSTDGARDVVDLPYRSMSSNAPITLHLVVHLKPYLLVFSCLRAKKLIDCDERGTLLLLFVRVLNRERTIEGIEPPVY